MQVDFPRGGSTVKRKHENKAGIDDRLFAERIKPRQKDKQRSWAIENEESLPFEEARHVSQIEPISRKTLVEGTLMMGFVRKLRTYNIDVELPNNLTGTVALTDISDSYTEQLRKYVQSSESERSSEHPTRTKDLFSVGSCVLCKVISVPDESYANRNGKIRMKPLALTLNPKHVNEDVIRIKPRRGMVLTGAIDSVEEHGYIIDLGLGMTKGFLADTKAKEYIENVNEGNCLLVGQVIFCSISSCTKSLKWNETRIIQLGVKLKDVKFLRKRKTYLLRAGSAVRAKISKIFDDGLCIEWKNLRGFVPLNNRLEPFRVKRDEYSIDQEVIGRILYIHPVSEICFVNILHHVCSLDARSELFRGLCENDAVHGAKVVRVSDFDAVLRLEDGILAVANKSLVPNIEHMEIGSDQSFYVHCFNFLDNYVVLREAPPDFAVEDISAGSFVDGKVNLVMESNVRVSLTNHINGLIPFCHLADDEFTDDILAEFSIGKETKCRVLTVYADRNLVILTARPSLMAPELPILSSYKDANPGTVAAGWIEKITPTGLLVRFFGNVMGFLWKKRVAHFDASSFKCSQMVVCSVVSYDPQSNKLDLALKDSTNKRSKAINCELNDGLIGKAQPLKDVKNSKRKNGKSFSVSQEVDLDAKIGKGNNETSTTKAKEKSFVKNVTTSANKEKDATGSSKPKKKQNSNGDESLNSVEDSHVDGLAEPTRMKRKTARDEASDLLNVDVNLSNYSDFDELSKKIKSYLEEVPVVMTSESEDSDDDYVKLAQMLKRNGMHDEVTKKSRNEAKSVKRQKVEKPIERLKVSTGFVWDVKDLDACLKRQRQDDSSSDDDGADEKEEPKVVSSRKVRSKKRNLEERLEENDLFKTEHLLMDPERKPESVDDFDRLVLSSPNSSLVWLKYMAFHLQAAEFEKARAVAERALKTISFREEQEKRNVWVAYLNLENLYGTSASLKVVFTRALQYNKPIDIYNQMVAIYESTDKIQAAESLYVTMAKRFKTSKEVWFDYGTFLMKNGKLSSARSALERSLVCLPKKEHVGVVAKFASLEFKYGEQQRGRTMFESVLSSYAKRIDIWFMYADLVAKSGDLEGTRLIFERMITLKIQAKKVKSVFTKYLEFEKQHGTDKLVARIIQKAEEYVKVDDLENVGDV